jgi:hypothetical protein
LGDISVDTIALAAALRLVGKGFIDAAAALEDGSHDDKLGREIAAMKEFDLTASEGLTRAQASQALKRYGIDPRAFGSWVRHDWVIRDGDRRYLSPKGRQWLKDHHATA